MLIFGVDLGTRRIAVGCPELSFVWSCSLENAAGRRNHPTEIDAGLELGARALKELVEWNLPAERLCVFVAERPFLRTQRPNVQTAVGMALSAGAALSQLPGDVRLLRHPTVWKKALCGNGNADKDEVRRTVVDREPTLAALCGEDENRFDAVGIALGSAHLAQDGDL